MTTIRPIALWLLFGCFVAGAFGIGAWAGYDLCLWDIEAIPPRIPTVKEVQTRLMVNFYDIGPEGADGVAGPNTIAAWEESSHKTECQDWADTVLAKMPKE